jgi:sulfotransferase family protein
VREEAAPCHLQRSGKRRRMAGDSSHDRGPLIAPGRAEPIFVHGILPRSGTNYLWGLLLLHPDCGGAREPVKEDLFLDHSDHLTGFVAAVRDAWDPSWGTFDNGLLDQLCAGIGEGLISFLWTDRVRRLVTKSPSVRHLDRFFAFFPQARLLILIRDGRSVVQSAIDTFGWDFDRACRDWSEAARAVRSFERRESSGGERWRIVRYEDLVDDPEGQMRAIFAFLNLDPSRYDFDAARGLPVRGSSVYGRKGSAVHWTAVPRNEGFAPKERWRSWTDAQLERFDWLAGEQLIDLGYAASRRRFSTLGSINHIMQDWRWHAFRTARRALYRARVQLALRSRIASALKGLGVRVAAR